MDPRLDHEDLRLARLLAAVRAEADPALWTRARARLEARPPVTGLLAWSMRPAALVASLSLFAAASVLALALSSGAPVTGEEQYATLADALLAEREADDPGAGDADAQDIPTGDTAPRDSGEHP